MHELSVCLSMLDQVRAIAKERDAVQVSKIYVQIGPLSGVEPDLLAQAFPIASAGTVAEQAELILENLELRILCLDCQAESPSPANNLLCPACGSNQTRLISGDELMLARVELITDDESAPGNETYH